MAMEQLLIVQYFSLKVTFCLLNTRLCVAYSYNILSMPSHFARKTLPHSAEKLFNLVKDVEKYPDFLPWVSGARILERNINENYFIAELLINFKAFSSSYISKVSYSQPGATKGKNEWAIYVDLEEGPFTFLENRWVFYPIDQRSCEVEFYLDFNFKSKMLETLVGGLFDKAVKKMVSAFEERANSLL